MHPINHPLLYPTQRVAEGIMFFIPHATSCYTPRNELRNSSETPEQNFVKLCSYEGHNVFMRMSTGNFDSILLLRGMPFLNLEIWPK